MQQWQDKNDYSNTAEQNRQTYVKEAEKSPKPKWNGSKVGFFAVVIILLIIAAALTFQISSNLLQINTLDSELTTNQEGLEVATNYQDELNTYVSMLQDEEYVAHLARSEYYLTGEDEIVFNFVDGDSSILSDVNKSEATMKEEQQNIQEDQG